jgi:tripartite-type tricarboxylate transporter receptor subunit TctC
MLSMLFACVAVSGAADAQSYPAKTIRVLTTEPGSANDLMVRLITPGLNAALGQPVVVENRGMVAMESVAHSTPDGYTLLAFGPPLWLLPLMRTNVPWDPVRDFAPITLAMSIPCIVAVHPSLPVKSVKELIALAKAKPGALNYATSFPGSSSQLSAELFKSMTGVSMVGITYKGPAQAVTALLQGEAQVSFVNAAASVTAHINAGRLRALAVASLAPSALFPNLPTVSASGVPGYQSATTIGIFAPAKTPEAVVDRLNQEMVRQLRRAEVKDKLLASGSEVVASTPLEFASAIRTEIATWGKVIRDANIHDQ